MSGNACANVATCPVPSRPPFTRPPAERPTPRPISPKQRDLFDGPWRDTSRLLFPDRQPKRHMHRVEGWEDGGGWDEENLEWGRVRVRAATSQYEHPDTLTEDDVEIAVLRAALYPGIDDPLPADREGRVAAMIERRSCRRPVLQPDDPKAEPDCVEAILGILRELAYQQLRDALEASGCDLSPPVVEVDRSARRPRFRLRQWKRDHRNPKGGYWVSLPKPKYRGSYPSEKEAQDARFLWIREHCPKSIDLVIPTYLAGLHEIAVCVGLAEPVATVPPLPEDTRDETERQMDEAARRGRERYGRSPLTRLPA